MKVVIVDQVGSNIGSLLRCLERCGVDLDSQMEFAKNHHSFTEATHVILAGVGSAIKAMNAVRSADLFESVKNLSCPTLGICVGMQIMYESSEEGAEEGSTVEGLGIFSGTVKKIVPPHHGAIIHNGWNKLKTESYSHEFRCFDGEYVYFIHQYAADSCPIQDRFVVDYGIKIPALVQKDNYYGMQFHPEKSAQVGQEMIQEFISL